jgi:hypothetical protein
MTHILHLLFKNMQAKKVGFEVGWAVRLDFGYSTRGPWHVHDPTTCTGHF